VPFSPNSCAYLGMKLLSLCALAWVVLPITRALADEPPVVPETDTTSTDAPKASEAPKPAPTPEIDQKPQIDAVNTTGFVLSSATGSARGVAEEFFVLPSGLDVGGKLRMVMADGGLGPGKLKLTDLAFFDMTAQWAIAKHYELDLSATVLPKQPSSTSEPFLQGGSLALRRDIGGRSALALAGAAGPLLGIQGLAFGGSLFVEHKHRLNEIVTFSLAGGASTTFVRPAGIDRPMLVEAAGHASVLVRAPNNMWGGWAGVGYAVPVYHHGHDPISGMELDPQPRLDLDIGNAVQLADRWDLTVALSIIDRGDLANPATRLPVLDGGFDQIQFLVGITRRIERTDEHRRGIGEPLIRL
jgi:hypothetical protein